MAASKGLATRCPHPDRPAKSKGMCQSCYRANQKAEALSKGEIKLDEEKGTDKKTGEPLELDFVNDPSAVREFYRILWGWLQAVQEAEKPIIVEVNGKQTRDFQLEARLKENATQKAMKAATVLGRAYIAERKIEEKPAEIQVEGMKDIVGGWMTVANSKKKVQTDA